MKKAMGFLALVCVLAGISVVVLNGGGNKREEICTQYRQMLSGTTYHGYDSTSTARNGDVGYYYDLELGVGLLPDPV